VDPAHAKRVLDAFAKALGIDANGSTLTPIDSPRKVCKRCCFPRPLTEFRPGETRDGLRGTCKPCEAETKRDRRRGEHEPTPAEPVPPASLRVEGGVKGGDKLPANSATGTAKEPPRAVGPSPFSGKARIAAEVRGRIESEAVRAPTTRNAPFSMPAADLGVKTWVVVSDVHTPYEDRHCTAAVTALCEDIAPDGMIIAGDFLDFYEISAHNRGSVAKMEGRRVSATYDAANALLDEWRWVTDFLDGNHEGRLEDWLHAGDNAAWLGDEAVDIAHRLRFKQRGIAYHKGEHSTKRLGKLVLTHGRWCNLYHAAKHLNEFRASVMYGHTHSPQSQFFSAYGHQMVSVGLGHLADPRSPAMSYAPEPNRWCQGFALVHVYPDETFRVVPINFWNQSFVYGGKHYGRRPVVQVP